MTTKELISALRLRALEGKIEKPQELFDIYKIAHSANSHRAVREFRVGNRVKFRGRKTGKNAGVFEGTIRQINQTTLSIEADKQNGEKLSYPHRWRISASTATLVGNGLQKLVQINNDKPSNSADNITQRGLNCPYCGRLCFSSSGLTLHKKSCKRRRV